MPIEDDIALFTQWAAGLGCPLTLIPNQESQKSILRAKRNLVITNLLAKVRPIQDVTKIRQNILVAKTRLQSQRKDSLIPAKEQLFVELQRFNKIKKLNQKLQEVDERILTYRNQFENISRVVKAKNIEKTKLTQELMDISTKHAIFVSKEQLLTTKVGNENLVLHKLQSIMPVKPSQAAKKQTAVAESAIVECLQLLDDFNQLFFTSADNSAMKEVKFQLWDQFRQKLAGIPNQVLWDKLLTMKDRQLENIKSASLRRSDKSKFDKPASDNEFLDLSISKLHTKHIVRVIKINAAIQQSQSLRADYDPMYEHFSEVLETKMSLMDGMAAKDVLDEFVVQLVTHSYHQGQITHLRNEIEKVRRQLDAKQVEDNDHLIGQLSAVYEEINSTFKRMQDEIVQLYQIKDKIDYSRSVTGYLAQDIRPHTMNLSRTVSSSFAANESMLSSTRIVGGVTDFDMTLRPTDNVAQPSQVPNYAAELVALNEVPVAKLRRAGVEEICKFYPNPLITLFCDDISTLDVMPYHALTINGALHELKKLCAWDHTVRKYMKDVHYDFDMCEVNKSKLKRLDIENNEVITELLDQIGHVTISSGQTIDRLRQYYNFLVTNPLRNYVPLSKLFNGRTYREYEAEYMMYFRILKGATTQQ